MWWYWLIIGAVALTIIVLWNRHSNKVRNSQRDKNEAKFDEILSSKGLKADERVYSVYTEHTKFISVDEGNRMVSHGFVTGKDFEFVTEEFPFDEVISFEVQINEEKKQGLSLGRAVAGGIIAGGVGAVIGGMSGKQKTKIHKMDLVLTVERISDPIIRIPILGQSADGKGHDAGSGWVAEASKVADKWVAIFKIIMKRSNSVEGQ